MATGSDGLMTTWDGNYDEEQTPSFQAPLISDEVANITSGHNPDGTEIPQYMTEREDGVANLADYGSSNVDYNNPNSFTSFIKSLFSPATDAQGRQQQSLAASMVVGAANGVMNNLLADKKNKAAMDQINQASSNRIKEGEAALNLTRSAASAMPTAKTNRKIGGLLAQR